MSLQELLFRRSDNRKETGHGLERQVSLLVAPDSHMLF